MTSGTTHVDKPVPEDLDAVDLADPNTYRDFDLAGMWRRFRDERPVHRQEATGDRPAFWALSRYDDVIATYRDHGHFTTERGNMLTTLLAGGDSASGKMLAVTDGRRHRDVRKAMANSFSPRVLRHVVEQIRARTRRLVTDVAGRVDFDYARDVADHIPMGTICDLLGIPEPDRPELLRWSKEVLSSDTGEPDQLEMALARNEILLYFTDLARIRRADPKDDVISELATCTVDGEPLTADEIIFNCYSLIIGGDESSRLSSTGAVLAFAQHPDQWRALKTGAVTADSAVEEILRWTTPAMHFGRRALVDTVVGDRTIRAGDPVTLWNTSANYDERVFADPTSFDLSRTPNKHLTFGQGAHFCLGAFLGREQLKAMVEAVRETVGSIELRGEPRQVYSNFMYGYSHLPVSFR